MSRTRVSRRDVIHTVEGESGRIQGKDLLAGSRIERLARHGKQLAILADNGRGVCVHLGMSGQLRYVPAGKSAERGDHIHCRWYVDGPLGRGQLIFRDPRRFGGIWVFPDAGLIERRWGKLGPDALRITAAQLRRAFAGRKRALKAALLDQQLIAGVGNIYADESLFLAGLHPEASCSALNKEEIAKLARAIRATLRSAVAAGGSTLRDYADGSGQAGWFTVQHRVYGRAGQGCVRCGKRLVGVRVAQRATAFCPGCQGGGVME